MKEGSYECPPASVRSEVIHGHHIAIVLANGQIDSAVANACSIVRTQVLVSGVRFAAPGPDTGSDMAHSRSAVQSAGSGACRDDP